MKRTFGIKIESSGKFEKTDKKLKRLSKIVDRSVFKKYGEKGVEALSAATPEDTGKTAKSWDYEIVYGKGRTTINWYNTNQNEGVSIAILIQYGHATKSNGFVRGRDYINPAIKPIVEEFVAEVQKEVDG